MRKELVEKGDESLRGGLRFGSLKVLVDVSLSGNRNVHRVEVLCEIHKMIPVLLLRTLVLRSRAQTINILIHLPRPVLRRGFVHVDNLLGTSVKEEVHVIASLSTLSFPVKVNLSLIVDLFETVLLSFCYEKLQNGEKPDLSLL